jgi:predicted DCC family thiol-disulfide oxidoreductase YuxK
MFVNYFDDDQRSSPINLAAARLLIGVWVVWKTVWYDWSRHVDVPYRATAGASYEWAIPVTAPWVLTIEKWALLGLIVLFVVGYRIRVTGLASAVLLAHLGAVRETLINSGETGSLFLGSFILLFLTLYADDDVLSVDGVRRTADRSVESLVTRLKSTADHQYRMPGLKYALLTIAILFFSTGLSKVVSGGGLEFVASDNLSRLVLVRSYVYPWLDVQQLVVDYPALGVLGGIGTLVLEMGFLVAVLFGVGFVPAVLGLVVFTLSNVLLLGIFFVDNLFFFALFVAFDRGYARLALDRELDLVFDEHCRFCARSLYPFKLLDVDGTVTFYSQYDVPEEYSERADVDLSRAMYVFDGDDAYEGYDAFRELLRQNRTFTPVVWTMGLPVVRSVGQRVYQYVADNRDRHFTCGAAEAD